MDEGIDFLVYTTIVLALDDNSRHWQVEIVDADRNKTALTSDHELYRFVRMLLGLCNAPDTSQRTIDVILFTVS